MFFIFKVTFIISGSLKSIVTFLRGADKFLIFDGEANAKFIGFEFESGLSLEGYNYYCILKLNENAPIRVPLAENKLLALPKMQKGTLKICFCAYKSNLKNQIYEKVKWQCIQCTIT